MVAGCQVDADDGGGSFLCTDECPDGMTCVAGRCEAVASDGGTDGAAVCQTATSADECAAVVDLTGAGAGQTVFASTENNTNAVGGCGGSPMPGADAAYRVSANAGQTLTATVTPTDFDVSLYISRTCAGTCVDLANAANDTSAETLTVTPTEAGDYSIIVDAPTLTGGCYELTVSLQ